LLQQIVLQKLFDNRFELFARMHHHVVIVDVDVSEQLISVVHQRTEQNDMLDRLIASVASTEDQLHVENFATMKNTRKFDFFDANLSREKAFDLLQLIMQLETCFVDLIDLCEDRDEHDERIRDLFVLSAIDVKSIHFILSLIVEQSDIEIEENEIHSKSESNRCRRFLLVRQLLCDSLVFQLVEDESV
jgi:hypothetical protein